MGDGELGHFTLLEKIGEGGMGRVYRARDTLLERVVAIKLLPEARVFDAERRARFIREARTASALNHPNIITIHEIAEDRGQTFIVMELVEGKPLNELIPRKGLRLNEALRIAVQIADAVAAAHASGIVHRDLKPGNVMVDQHGRVKVLDFGLAKLFAEAASAARADEATRTIDLEQPCTEEGVVLGSVPYMSPEQAEGKTLDARSDIFSFGAVLYEMITGQRAFRGDSRASTLAALVEKEPPPVSGIAGGVPQELERLIARCLRKDPARRSQNMADVRLALEELRDESESGRSARPAASQPARARVRRWAWPVVATVCAAIAAAVIVSTYGTHRDGTASQGAELIRLSPDDGYSYELPSISADGKFVAYTSDRGGSRQLWLQQVAGGDPIQLTHSADAVLGAQFFPDGARLGYATSSADGTRGSIEVIPTLGGQPQVLGGTQHLVSGGLSPDGRQAAYFESPAPAASSVRLVVRTSDGGEPRELTNWRDTQPVQGAYMAAAWTSDSRYLLSVGSKRAQSLNFDEWDWFALPVDGGLPRATGAGAALRAAGLRMTGPAVMSGERVLFAGGKSEQNHVWEIRLSPDTWHARGAPRQLTFGTENELPFSISASGTVAVDVFKNSTDLYQIPVSPTSGQPTGVSRRLTHDGRNKIRWPMGGDPGSVYFLVDDKEGNSYRAYALDLESGKQTLLIAGPVAGASAVSNNGRQIAYSVPEGGSYSIRIGDAGAAPTAARLLCKQCGRAARFFAGARYLSYQPEVRVKPDPKQKHTVRLLDVASGQDRPWLEHPTDSITAIGTFGADQAWVTIRTQRMGSQGGGRFYILPWREEPIPPSDWIEVRVPVDPYNYAPFGNFFQFFQGGKLMAIRFDPKQRTISDPYEVKYLPGTSVTVKPDDSWGLRGPGLVFSRQEITSSIWLMKLPQ